MDNWVERRIVAADIGILVVNEDGGRRLAAAKRGKLHNQEQSRHAVILVTNATGIFFFFWEGGQVIKSRKSPADSSFSMRSWVIKLSI